MDTENVMQNITIDKIVIVGIFVAAVFVAMSMLPSGSGSDPFMDANKKNNSKFLVPPKGGAL